MRIEAETFSRFHSMIVAYTKMMIFKLEKKNVKKSQRQMKEIVVIVLLTRASLRLRSVRESVNLTLLD